MGDCELEMMFEIWNGGECLEVGPDRDNLGLIEIRAKDIDGAIHNRMTLTKKQAEFLTTAILKLVEFEASNG